jgi:outer membrane protein OmpA-like peptidoglycan-associated protein/polyisoprenoid-binding protein YceI
MMARHLTGFAVCAMLALSTTIVAAGVREDCLQDKDQALAAKACPLYEAELAKQKDQKDASAPSSISAGDDSFFSQEWQLDPTKARLNVTTTKNKTIVETHSFTTLNGRVSPTGEAVVKIDLSSLDTSVDIRNVRMRFLFFETFKFPEAIVSTKLDKSKLQGLLTGKSVRYPLDFMLDLHGVKKRVTASVTVTRTATNAVSVSTDKPLLIQAADFALTAGVARLSKAAGGFEILPSAELTFDLVFQGTKFNPNVKAVVQAAAAKRTQQRNRDLSSEECENRMSVISKTRHIYFESGSADIDEKESKPVLDEVAQFTNRCKAIQIEISGHTDTDGGKSFNQDLSERRARAVAEALVDKGLAKDRLNTIGFGYSRPVADNSTEEGKAENRRIEFHRQK